MKSRRPPLNLTEPKAKAQGRSAPDALSDTEIAVATTEDAPVAEIDILDAPLVVPELRELPVREFPAREFPTKEFKDLIPAPEAVAEPIEAPHAEVSELDIPPVEAAPPTPEAIKPDIFTQLKPPPEATPPARAQQATAGDETRKVETETRDLRTLKVEPEGILKTTGGSGTIFWICVIGVSLLWMCGLPAFVLGAQSDVTAFTLMSFRTVVVAFLAIFPVGMIWASAFALRNAAALSRQTQRAAALADSMLAPATAAAMQTHELVDGLRAQVDHAVRAVRLAHADITELSARLKAETDRLAETAQVARAATQHISGTLEQERTTMQSVSDSLGAQANSIIEAVDRQARMVADASDLAQTQLRDAETALTARATDMMGAASGVSDTARTISEDLDRQTQRLETAGSGVADQIRSVEEGLSQQRAGLVSAALSLRADQEDFAVHIENQRAQLTEALSITRIATVDLGETSARGIDVLRDIVLSAQENFRALNGAAEGERTAFETRIHATLSNISVMAADARDDLIDETKRSLDQLNVAATEARRAADMAAQTAQARVDRLNESIFEASKKADEVFDSRFSAARRLIEDSADLISEAGDQTAAKLDNSFAHTRIAIAEVTEALNELTSSADQLPVMAQDRLRDIRKSVEEGLAAMTASAKRAALETEAVDQAFQERVKRNYEMLSEAVRLMGVISGDAPISGGSSDERFRERDYGRGFGAGRKGEPTQAMPRPVPAAQPAQMPAQNAQQTPRMRLSPLSAETRPSPGPVAQNPSSQTAASPKTTVASNKPAAQAAGPDGWSWRDLLNGMEGRDGLAIPPAETTMKGFEALEGVPPHDANFENLEDLMVNEINAMGVDAAALISRSRIEETISAIIAEDNEGARMVIRRVAPAAIRRLSRRLLSDIALREQAHEFATAYDQHINMALVQKDPSRALQGVLSNDTGRAYLLLDAAISDLI